MYFGRKLGTNVRIENYGNQTISYLFQTSVTENDWRARDVTHITRML